VRAVEMRPGTPAGRRITHHVLARLLQDEKDPLAINDGSGTLPGSAGLLMEWAIGKNYDVYRPNTGKLLLPDRRSGGNCTCTRSVKRSGITRSSPFIFIRKGRNRSTGPA